MRKITFLISLLVSVWATAQTSLPLPSTDGDPHYYKFLNAVDSDMRITTNGNGFKTTQEEASTLFTFEAVDGEEGVYYIKSATYDGYVSAKDVEEGQKLKWTTDKTDTEKWILKENGNSIAVVAYATKDEDAAAQLAWTPSNTTITNPSNIVLGRCDATTNLESFWTLAKKNPPQAPGWKPVPVSDITPGWYQMKVIKGVTTDPLDGEDKAAGRYVTTTPTEYVKDGKTYALSLRAQNVVSSTFVYIDKNESGKFAIKTSKGKYVSESGVITDSPVYPFIFEARYNDQTNISVYTPNTSNTQKHKCLMGWYDIGSNTLFVGMASSSSFLDRTFQFSKVDDYIAEHYDVYGIEYKDFTPVHGAVGVTYHAADYNGVRLAYPGGAYFIRKDRGQDVLASNFEITSNRNTNFLYLESDMENKKILVGQNLTATVEEMLRLSEDPNQVGFPATGLETYNAPLREALKTAQGTANLTNLGNLETAFTTWKTTVGGLGNVVMPKDGKAYYLRNVQQNLKNNYLLANDENGELIVKSYSDENKDLNAAFVCHKMDDGRYIFTNAAKGNYMVWKGQGYGYNDNKGYSETYLAAKCAFNVNNQASTSRPGLFRLVVQQRGANQQDLSSLVLTSDGSFNGWNNTVCWQSGFSNAFCFEEATDYNMNNVTLQNPATADGYNYASLYLPYATTIPEGVEAFSATLSDDQQSLNLAAIEGTTLPKHTAVVLRSANETAATFVPAIEPGTKPADNSLTGTVNSTVATPEGTFVLSGAFGKIGFYKYTAENLPAGKAYISLFGAAPVQGLLFGDGNVTGIEAVETGNDDKAAYYDLSGRRVEHPVTGIYVRGGKKVFVK